MRPRADRARLLAALLGATLLVGCSTSLPTDSTPRAGLPVEVQPREDVQRVLPGPEQDASSTEIVRGFLRANVSFAEDEDVAREFLTASLASEWIPTSNVMVLDGSPEIRLVGPGVVSVRRQVSGRIDATGRLSLLPAGTVATETFRLTPVDGQWRISGFPEDFGLWLSRADLDQAFRATTVNYLNPVLRVYVPEVRWLAEGEGLPTSVARAQLAPVPVFLEGAVATGGAGDGRLTVAGVPVDPATGVATVNLQGAGVGEDTERVEMLRAQLAHALLALTAVRGVDLSLSGRSLDPDGPLTSESDLGYRDAVRDVDRVLLRAQDRLLAVDPGHSALPNLPTAQLDLPNVPIRWTGIGASEDVSSLAAVSTDGTQLWRWQSGEESVNPGIGDELTPPGFDPHGYLWVAGAARGGGAPRVWFTDTAEVDSLARPLDVPTLARDDRISAFRVSPDGARALLVVRHAGDPDAGRLLVAGIVRDDTGRPTALATPTDVAPTLETVTEAYWGTTTELLATGRRAGDETLLGFRVALGGWLRALGALEGLVEVVPIPDGEGYSPVARTEDGRFHTTEGSSGWYSARNGDELLIPGG